MIKRLLSGCRDGLIDLVPLGFAHPKGTGFSLGYVNRLRAGLQLPANGGHIMAANLDKYLDLFREKKAFAHIATVMPDGSPQVTPVWIDYRDGHIAFNTARGRVKDRNLKEGAKVALSVLDPDNPYRYVQVRGVVSKVTEEGANKHIDSLAKKYMGLDRYPFHSEKERRVTYEIEAKSVQGMGN
jgi:PPOX class probable F420-dependent enzyme